ncbi:MAG: hypothetical protein PHQ42_03385 [Patescibacteria group bacterium]|nr:hypothetical protein [Patescibacteria group bacterium]
MQDERMEIEIEINCPSCSSSIFFNNLEIDFIGLDFTDGENIIFNISRHISLPCLACGKEWFLPYVEFLALCAKIEICPN